MGLRIILLLVVCSASYLQAAQSDYHFIDPKGQQRFYQLSNELRCSFCQNQSIAESNSLHAIDVRAQIYHMVQEGKSDQAIFDFLTYRYGDQVLPNPRWSNLPRLLWIGPLVMLLVAAWFSLHLFRILRSSSLEEYI